MIKFNKLNFLCLYIASINFSCLNIASAACNVVETLQLQCKHFTQTKIILHRHACGACDKIHVCVHYHFAYHTIKIICDHYFSSRKSKKYILFGYKNAKDLNVQELHYIFRKYIFCKECKKGFTEQSCTHSVFTRNTLVNLQQMQIQEEHSRI